MPASASNIASEGFSFQLYSFLHLPIDLELFHVLIRKLAHFTEYAILGMLMASSLKKDHWNKGIFLCLCVACMDEIIQLFIDGRSGEIRDVMIDGAGVIIGFFIIYILNCFIKKHNQLINKHKH